MSLLRTFDKATGPHATTTIASTPLWHFFCPLLNQQSPKQQKRRFTSQPVRDPAQRSIRRQVKERSDPPSIENVFFNALSQAGRCRRHIQYNSRPAYTCPDKSGRPSDSRERSTETVRRRPSSRSIHTTSKKAGQSAQATAEDVQDLAAQSVDSWVWEINAIPNSAKGTSRPYKKQMKELSNVYHEWESDKFPSLPEEEVVAGPGPPTVTIEEMEDGPQDPIPIAVLLGKLDQLLTGDRAQVRNPERTAIAAAMYFRLPQPRASHVPRWQLTTLLRSIAWSRKSQLRTPASWAQMYLRVLDDMKGYGVPIAQTEWNIAISMAAETVGRLGREHVEAALAVWQQMESQYGQKGDIATFTILFDQATKAGKFVLADMIYREIINRGLVIDRYTRLARIYYHGKRGDGEAVRFSYARFVDAGEIVTTSTLTCVIDSLFNAGEPAAAEQVFANMKHHHDTIVAATLPPQTHSEEKVLLNIVKSAAEKWRDHPEVRKSIQEAAPIGPNVRTYKSLVRYYAYEQGDLERVLSLLDEMATRRLKADWSIYMWILRAFERHGGVPFTSWTGARLDRIWERMLLAADSTPEDFVIAGKTNCAVGAFVRCSSREKAYLVFDVWVERWRPERALSDRILKRIERMRD